MSKHAYLIIDSGKNFDQLQTLLNQLDDVRNDIFIHIDKKYKGEIPDLNVKNSELCLIKNRIPVFWGGISIVECEYLLFETAFNYSDYSYFHLLSGQDLPLQSQDYIHSFFDKNAGQEFISFDFYRTNNDKEIMNRFKHYHLFSNYSFKSSKTLVSNIFIRGFRRIENSIQTYLKVDREKKSQLKYYYGSQWVSIDQELVDYLINNKKLILSNLMRTNISDELFVQTVVWNNNYFKNKVYKFKENYENSNLRYINWNLGRPYTWESKNYDLLKDAIQSGFLFSRKFDSSIDNKVILKLINKR